MPIRFVILPVCAVGLDNGLAITPPMGWRSWNQMGLDINQTFVEKVFEALADRSRIVDGWHTSLADLGYTRAGIDDGWQLCNSGPDGKGFHNASGYPIEDKTKFPNMKKMTDKAKGLDLHPGWYQGNCHCSDHRCSGDECYAGDANATADFGFESVKIDSCSVDHDVSKMSQLFNHSANPVLIENCHNGVAHRNSIGEVVCPMNLFRTSGDIRPTYGSILKNLRSVTKFNQNNLTGPGCWAYPDMLEVGVTHSTPPGAKHHCESASDPCQMNLTEWKTHFGAWCIVSAPLILGMDVTDQVTLDQVWAVLTNREAIEVNQLWMGDSGRLHSESAQTSRMPNCGSGSGCDQPSWMVWSKALPPKLGETGVRAAVLLMNNANISANVSVDLSSVHGLGSCAVDYTLRDIWKRTNSSTAGVVNTGLSPHASHFFVASCSDLAPVPTPPAPTPGSDCLEHAVRYDSHKAGNTNLLSNYMLAADGPSCQQICSNSTGCKCFTHRISTGHCWLMTSCQTPEDDDRYVSGPASCPPLQAVI